MQINFRVKNQHISRVGRNTIVSDSVNVLTTSFTFSGEWEELGKTVIFKKGNTVLHVLLDSSNTCVVPSEILKPGVAFISVFGSYEGKRITTDYYELTVSRSGYFDENAKPEDPTPTVYEEIVDKVTNFKETDPTVPDWAKQNTKPEYTASEVGALSAKNEISFSTIDSLFSNVFGNK